MTDPVRERVLVVEDDDHIRRFIAINLSRNGFSVAEAASGAEAAARLSDSRPGVVLLDVMLPDADGFEIGRRIREADPRLVLIFLTARGQDMDKIKGLELGADDYVVKPFHPLELVARIKSVLRRTRLSHVPERRVLRSGRVRLDLDSKSAYVGDQAVELTPKEFGMLRAFLENPGIALSRNDLLNAAWGEDFVGGMKTVDVHVRKLREKFDAGGSDPMRIETVWGIGYRWREDG